MVQRIRTTHVRHALLAGAVALACSSCLRLDWRRVSRFEPLSETLDASLAVGVSDLDDCLDAFGAPLWVRELAGEERAAALAWGWFESKTIGFRVSYAFDRFVTASLDYSDLDAEMEGVVAVFDADWRLVELERGLLMDLTSEERLARPADVEDS